MDTQNVTALKAKLAAIRKERESQDRDLANGKIQMIVQVTDIYGEEATSANGNDYHRVVCKFVSSKGEDRTRIAPIWTPEAEFIIENLKAGEKYRVIAKKGDSGFWEWISAQPLETNDSAGLAES